MRGSDGWSALFSAALGAPWYGVKGGQRSRQLPAELTQLLLLFPPPNTEVFLLVCVHSVFNTARSSRERGAVGSQASAAGAVL